MLHTASTLFVLWCGMFEIMRKVWIKISIFSLLYILVQFSLGFIIQRVLFQNWAGLFAPCCIPLPFMKATFHYRLWQWHAYFLENVFDSAGCCKEVLFHHGNNSAIIHLSCLPWSSFCCCWACPVDSFFSPDTIYQNIDLATPDLFTIFLIGFLFFF